MICISINQESRRLALVDMFNAAKQCDLLEIRLDRFGMAPELGEMLSHKPTPVIMSCRRKKEGGFWDGTEGERLALLRQAIISKADYVEIELDVADQIKRMPPTKRVIACTINPKDSTQDVAELYAEAQTKDPDIIKLTAHIRTPEEAWPFVQILAKPAVPTVVVGLGRPGIMLTILAKKVEMPWTYAALEKGMEAYPGQPTVNELKNVYHYDKIGRKTRLIGVTGFGDREFLTVAGLNAALAHLELGARCLPLGVGSAKHFSKVIDATKLAGVLIDPAHQQVLLRIAEEQHPSASYAEATDLILEKGENWTSYYTSAQAAVAALSNVLKNKTKADEPMQNRLAMIVGINPLARTIAADLQHRGAGIILASHHRKAAQELAKKLDCRQIQFEALYSTLHDILIMCDEEKDKNKDAKGMNLSFLKGSTAIMDLTAEIKDTALLKEARARGCQVVHPRDVLLQQLQLQTNLITGKQVELEVFSGGFPEWAMED